MASLETFENGRLWEEGAGLPHQTFCNRHQTVAQLCSSNPVSDFFPPLARMGLTLSSVFGRLFGKKQMRILMGEKLDHVPPWFEFMTHFWLCCDAHVMMWTVLWRKERHVSDKIKLIPCALKVEYFSFSSMPFLFLVGLDAAGKTTILYKLKLGEIVTTIPTIGKLIIMLNITFMITIPTIGKLIIMLNIAI